MCECVSCMHVHVCVHQCMCMHVHVCVHESMCMHVHFVCACMSACVRVCMSACACMYMCVCMSACVCVCMSACVRVCMSACVRVCMSTCACMCNNSFSTQFKISSFSTQPLLAKTQLNKIIKRGGGVNWENLIGINCLGFYISPSFGQAS